MDWQSRINPSTLTTHRMSPDMAKAMIFVDGSWLYRNTPHLGEKFGRSVFHIDYSKFPGVLLDAVGER